MSKKKRASLQDIADQVGVTKMTVSRFLRDPTQVSQQTSARISEALEILAYIPNRAPKMLASAKSCMIGVLIPSLTNLVFSEVIRGIELVTAAEGYQTVLSHYGYSAQKEESLIASLLSYNIDGLLLSEAVHTEKTLKLIEHAGIPVVEMMDLNTPPIMQAVGFNNIEAAKAMVEAMIAKGHRHIVYLGARMDLRTQLKMQGYTQTMVAHHLTPQHMTTEEASSFSLGAQLLNQAKAAFPDMDGVFCTNDDLAIGALFECLRQGMAIPQQIAIAGFHGHDVGQAMFPRLASVITPRKAIGRVAATELIARLNGVPQTDSAIDLGFEISFGDSI